MNIKTVKYIFKNRKEYQKGRTKEHFIYKLYYSEKEKVIEIINILKNADIHVDKYEYEEINGWDESTELYKLYFDEENNNKLLDWVNITLTIVRGITGSGKTTRSTEIVNEKQNTVMFAADDYFMVNGKYEYNNDKIKEAHWYCQEKTEEALQKGQNVVVHNTFTRRWEVKPYKEFADKHGAVFKVIDLFDGGKTDDELFERCVHNVPLQVIQRMRKHYHHDLLF